MGAQPFGQRGRGLHVHKHKDALLLARAVVRTQQKMPKYGGAQHLTDQEHEVEGDTGKEGKEQPGEKNVIPGPPRIGGLDHKSAELEPEDDDYEVEEGLEQQMDGERGASEHGRKAAQVEAGLESR